ncbi:MAG: hypothetical protein S0880_04200 [Actinomycetota bacterium]|nr:hypothetical protein [Actinomycetota bacterium]
MTSIDTVNDVTVSFQYLSMTGVRHLGFNDWCHCRRGAAQVRRGRIAVGSRSWKTRLLALGACAGLVLAACGSDGDDDDVATEDTPSAEDTAEGAEDTAGDEAESSDEGGEPVELSFFMGNVEANVQTAEALVAAFEEANPDITIDLDSSGPTGAEGDNLTKTKLATGEMEDLFWYNSGSLFQALNPDESLMNMAGEPWVDSLNEAYIETVSTDNGVYGAPAGTATGGGVFYYVDHYDELAPNGHGECDSVMCGCAEEPF